MTSLAAGVYVLSYAATAWIFGIASVSKLVDLDAFSTSLARLLPFHVGHVRLVAVLVAASEALVVLFLAIDTSTSAGFALALVLLVVSSVVVAVAVARGVEAPCGCFGASSEPVGFRTIVRNCGIALPVAYGLAAEPRYASVLQTLGASQVVSIGLLSGALALVVVSVDDIVSVVRGA